MNDKELAEIRERQRHVAESPVIDGTKIDRLVRKDVPKLLSRIEELEARLKIYEK